MARILTVDPDQAKGLRKLVARAIGRQFGGELPGVFKILLTDFQVAIPRVCSCTTSTSARVRR
jgi:hypothetical protein